MACLLAAETSEGRTDRLEADWLRQDLVRNEPARSGPVTTAEDAAGACDGIKNGRWGFHTNREENPWWQVDLGEVHELSRVLVYNRCDNSTVTRANHLIVALSSDGQAWEEAYRHDGKTFYGHPDGKPLAVTLDNKPARFVRISLPGNEYLHLDEVEVRGVKTKRKNLAHRKPADQSSASQWSARGTRPDADTEPTYPVDVVLERGQRLLADLGEAELNVERFGRALDEITKRASALPDDASLEARRAVYLDARSTVRKLALANPLLDFDRILFVKRSPGTYSHMSDQYYGWWSRPGGGVCVLEGFKGDASQVRCLTDSMPEGSFLRPDLSHDGTKVVFAYCRHYAHVAKIKDKVKKEDLPDDAFYHIYEMNIDGTGLRQLTRGRYDDFDARYLPNGEIVFLSTRRGHFIQCGPASAGQTIEATLPDSYVRCGGGPYRPVAVYTLHVMDADGGRMRAISPFENFEWTPSIADDGRVLFARWDYVDRHNMPYMSLWSTNPDGTNPQIVYGNFTRSPHCLFEARSVPDSTKLILTASAHHSITAGSLVLLDPRGGVDGQAPLTRLTPEVCFPESEGWPETYYANPYPLSETYYLTAWSDTPIRREGQLNPPNALGLYVYDAFGNLELLHRDPDLSSMYPIPLRSRRRPPIVSDRMALNGEHEGRIVLLDVYDGLPESVRGRVKRLRVVGMPAKTQPTMNTPKLGATRDDPGKYVLGTVPVEADGSAHFRVPAGVALFIQALDADGLAIQTMRSLTYVQPNQTLTCIGCHESRAAAPTNVRAVAASRPPSRIAVGPEGSWPLRYDRLVQPVLDRHCVSCHRPDAPDEAAAKFDLTAEKSYEAMVAYGKPSLHDHVLHRYREGRSIARAGAAQESRLLALLREGDGHYDVRLDDDAFARLVTWMDTYAQRLGSFSPDQEQRLRDLKHKWAAMLDE